MTNTVMTVNAASISRKLSKAYRKSTSTTTLIKGAHITTWGYKVEQWGAGVKVYWQIPSGFRKDLAADIAECNEMLEHIANHLTTLGYNATVINPNLGLPAVWIAKN